jgi:hypothetical protein
LIAENSALARSMWALARPIPASRVDRKDAKRPGGADDLVERGSSRVMLRLEGLFAPGERFGPG